ncbi:MAG: HAMP domain-containing histidine kinase [Deltaproteobacteria bacterium]
MSDTAFLSITVLLLLWILTAFALVRALKKKRDGADQAPPPSLDLLLGLVSKGREEAKEAARKLSEVLDALGLGLVEVTAGGIAANACALSLLGVMRPEEAGLREILDSLLPNERMTIRVEDRTVQITRIKDSVQGGGLLLVQDVTRAAEAEQRIRQRERLAHLGKMTAQMAHQMKTHTAILAGRAQLLARELEGSPALREKAREIYTEARELAGRIDEIVSIYKTDGKARETVGIADVLYSVRKRLDSMEKPCTITVEAADDLVVTTDRAALESILFLLGQNSLAEEVRASQVTLSAREEGDSVVISVTDNGAGIPASLRDRIFEPFTGESKGGLGLGLFLARDLAERLGGGLRLMDVEKGTSFGLFLPRVTAALETCPSAPLGRR